MDSYLWQKSQWKDAHQEAIESCYRYEGRACANEGEGVSVVEERERRGAWVYIGIIEKEVYQTLEITSNSTGIFCRKEGWKEADGIRL